MPPTLDKISVLTTQQKERSPDAKEQCQKHLRPLVNYFLADDFECASVECWCAWPDCSCAFFE